VAFLGIERQPFLKAMAFLVLDAGSTLPGTVLTNAEDSASVLRLKQKYIIYNILLPRGTVVLEKSLGDQPFFPTIRTD
jgi:hypothetical protein